MSKLVIEISKNFQKILQKKFHLSKINSLFLTPSTGSSWKAGLEELDIHSK